MTDGAYQPDPKAAPERQQAYLTFNEDRRKAAQITLTWHEWTWCKRAEHKRAEHVKGARHVAHPTDAAEIADLKAQLEDARAVLRRTITISLDALRLACDKVRVLRKELTKAQDANTHRNLRQKADLQTANHLLAEARRKIDRLSRDCVVPALYRAEARVKELEARCARSEPISDAQAVANICAQPAVEGARWAQHTGRWTGEKYPAGRPGPLDWEPWPDKAEFVDQEIGAPRDHLPVWDTARYRK